MPNIGFWPIKRLQSTDVLSISPITNHPLLKATSNLYSLDLGCLFLQMNSPNPSIAMRPSSMSTSSLMPDSGIESQVPLVSTGKRHSCRTGLLGSEG